MGRILFQCALIATLALHFVQLGRGDYCTNSLALSSCPDYLSTADSIDLSAYGGKWYEIGSTASFKNVFETGGVCAVAEYKVTSSTTVEISNSEFLSATPTVGTAVVGVATSSAAVCVGARAICTEINVDTSLLQDGISAVVKFQSDIASSYSTEAAMVSSSISQIQQAASALGPQIDQLSTYVNKLQTANSQLSQTDGDVSSVVGTIQVIIDSANAQVTALDNNYQTISSQQEQLISVAKGLFGKGGAAVGPSFTLTAAATEILGGAKVIQASVATMSTAFAASSKAVGYTLKDETKPYYNVSTVMGKAVVNGSNAKLSVTIGSSKVPPSKYWVLALNGAASTGYDSALVYSCNDGVAGGADQVIYVLSRTPSLSSTVTDAFLQTAASMGINQDCDAPFVYTVRSDKCSI